MRTSRFGLACGAVVLAALLSGCGSDSSGGTGSTDNLAPGGVKPAPELDFTEFDSAVDQYLADNELEGASVVVVHKDWGMVHSSGYGAFDADRLYLIASSSKVLSVGILMKFADEGKLDLDAPIGACSRIGQGTS